MTYLIFLACDACGGTAEGWLTKKRQGEGWECDRYGGAARHFCPSCSGSAPEPEPVAFKPEVVR